MSLYEKYKSEIYNTFNYILNTNNVDDIDYRYALGLLFESIYFGSKEFIQDFKIIFKDFDIDINTLHPNAIQYLDLDYTDVYLYIFSEVKKDIETINDISDDTKLKILVIFNKLGDKRFPFVSIEEEKKYDKV